MIFLLPWLGMGYLLSEPGQASGGKTHKSVSFDPFWPDPSEDSKSQICPHWASSDLSITVQGFLPHWPWPMRRMILSPLHKHHFSKVTQPQFQPGFLDSKSTTPCGENENWKQESPLPSVGPGQWRTFVTVPGKTEQVSRNSGPSVNPVTAVAHGTLETKLLSRL